MLHAIDDVRPEALNTLRDLLLAQPNRVGIELNIKGRCAVFALVEQHLTRRRPLRHAARSWVCTVSSCPGISQWSGIIEIR